ncbi:hypothetical protein G7Y89_g8881 [Cudoniella acicularis]|uniref:Uncharacterized protein n=1 Tax=Cudoniella acicularis TaxID=354080 RepID=A0A8H4RFS9_9HELO|nr:hypothetical protein G7Y89_g8881 [Cudoniella acicularis]
MPEIDHTPPPPPEPARPITADRLLALEIEQRKRFGGERVGTGCEVLDELFGSASGGDGLERGIVIGVSCEGREGEGVLISLHLLASILLPHLSTTQRNATPITKATIIDTTGSFPLSLLARILKSRILLSRSATSRQNVETANYRPVHDENSDAPNVEEVQRCLEMVAVSRVFDIEGLWEVLGEIGRAHVPVPVPAEHEGSSPPWESNTPELKSKSPQILDSDEDEEEVLETEMKQPVDIEKSENHDCEEGIEIVIVDNMTHIINELFGRKEKNDAHNILTSLSCALHSVTRAQNILTILHNTTTPSTSSSFNPSKSANTTQTAKSIFEGNTIKPSLGAIFSQLVELHIFISRIPKMRRDAEVLYGEDENEDGMGAGMQDGVGYCFVAEILKDECPNLPLDLNANGRDTPSVKQIKKKFAAREQKWVPLELVLEGGEGIGFKAAFMKNGNMRSMGLER